MGRDTARRGQKKKKKQENEVPRPKQSSNRIKIDLPEETEMKRCEEPKTKSLFSDIYFVTSNHLLYI